MTNVDKKKALFITAGIGLAFAAYRYRHKIMEPLRIIHNFRNPLGHRKIVIIENSDDCGVIVKQLQDHLGKFPVLGFDCEWVTIAGKRRPVALLQLASQKGLCALFRLCQIEQIPKSLRDLLEDDKILKVGVGPQDDAQKLAYDYGVGVASTFDLRFLAAMTDHKAEGLAKLSKKLLNVHLDKNWRIVCSDWEARTLTDTQQRYAANDALVAVEIFKKMIKNLEPRNHWNFFLNRLSVVHLNRLEPFLEINFREGYLTNLVSNKSEKVFGSKVSKKQFTKSHMQSRGMANCVRSKAMYDNCLLEAPDGDLLCTIDRRKAQWYVDQNLGNVVENAETFTVRLNFEPAGRAVGEVGRYYKTPKENQCVVCGRRDVYIRKNVVPREYRRHFPVVMKSHTSHDVLLLCPHCHQLSNISDLKIRRKLAEICNAPLSNDDGAFKHIEIPELKKLRSAARALMQSRNKLPEERRQELECIILQHYANEKELTQDLLEETANMETSNLNENYREHGEKVVECFQTKLGGLIELERMWREHFLDTMHPQFLPELWNVNHNADRLEIRAQEGRIKEQDLALAGLNLAKPINDVSKTESDT